VTRLERSLADRLTTAALVACAFVMVGLSIAREISSRNERRQDALIANYLPGWESTLVHAMGASSALGVPTLIEFLDLQCPACSAFHTTQLQRLRSLVDSSSYRHLIVHTPLSIHPEARDAAVASLCANDQGAFRDFVEFALENQRSFRARPWLAFADSIGVGDRTKFASCLERADAKYSSVETSSRAALELSVHSTPTLLLDGWRLERLPTAERLADAIRARRRGDRPEGFAPEPESVRGPRLRP
jgi:hypothetical protein